MASSGEFAQLLRQAVDNPDRWDALINFVDKLRNHPDAKCVPW